MSTTQAMRPTRASRRPNLATMAIVGAIHIVVICGLYLGLTKQISIPTIKDIQTDFIKPKHDLPTLPTQPTYKFVKPADQTVEAPKIPIDNSFEGPGTITPPDRGDTYTVPVAPTIVAARGIMGTHSTPDYPSLAVRLNQTGNVMLKLTIDERGAVTAASVEKSSGYDSLDNAAVAWVIAHWRYEPATKDGTPLVTTTDALVTFRLTGR